MITKEQAKTGVRVKWVSLDASVPVAYGVIADTGPSDLLDPGEVEIHCDDGDTSSTFIGNAASRWFIA